MTRNRYPVDTCTAQLASRVICIYVFAPCVRFHSRDFRLESCLCASFSRPKPFHPRETGLIMRVGKSWITLFVFASYVYPNIRNINSLPSKRYFCSRAILGICPIFIGVALFTFRLYATYAVATPPFLILPCCNVFFIAESNFF